MGLVKLYMVAAFVIWKGSCVYIDDERGLFLPFTAGPGSLAVGGGYVLGLLILLGRAFGQFKAKQFKDLIGTLIFTGIGLFFLMLGTGWAGLLLNSAGFPVSLATNGLLLYFSFKGLRALKSRAFLYWTWGFAINLVREIVLNLCSAASAPVVPGRPAVNWFWHSGLFFGASAPLAEPLLEACWLGHVVAGVLIAAGLILLVRQWGPDISRPAPINTSRQVAGGVLFLLIGIYPSLKWFGSPGVVTAVVLNAVMFGYALSAGRRRQGRCFDLWALACAITLLVTLGGTVVRARALPPGEFDLTPLFLELLTPLGWLADLLWVAGLMLALRQLAPAPSPNNTPPSAAPKIVLLPRPPGWMKKRLAILIGFGILAISIVWLCQYDPSQVFSLEPKYEGHTLNYWMDHWYVNDWGGGNTEAMAALKSMGAKAVPYLLDWMARPSNFSSGGQYQIRALQGFKVLGPAAKSAVPKLIKMLGGRSHDAEIALADIGSDAVPALADKLVETLTDTNAPNLFRRRPGPAEVQQSVLATLGMMGTKAGAAVPALLQAVRSQYPWTQAGAAQALGDAGVNQPDLVLPPLIQVFTNSETEPLVQAVLAETLSTVGRDRPGLVVPVLTEAFANPGLRAAPARPARLPFFIYYLHRVSDGSPDGVRVEIADALATFGGNARGAVPVLLLAGQSTNALLRAHAAVAVQTIAPETPEALGPLLKNLAEPDKQVRQQALEMIGQLGTNGAAALPALTRLCRLDPDPEIREAAIRCVGKTGRCNDEVISALNENALGPHGQTAQPAVETLAGFAPRSKQAFLLLANIMTTGPAREARHSAREQLEMILGNNARVLDECLADTNSQTRYQTLLLVDNLGLHLPEALPALKLALQDENPEARTLATNMLKGF